MKTCFLLLFALFVTYVKCEQGELLSVVAIFRHGDRTPIYMYKNDRYNSSYWPIGLGQLTNRGKQRHYELGKWFRNRYDGFLPRTYNRSYIHVRSTDVDRTLMSVQSNLAGSYPPIKWQVWHQQLMWQPIPVHTVPELTDNLLAQKAENCPRYSELFYELQNSVDFQKLLEEHQDIFRALSRYSGNNIADFCDFSNLFDTLFVEKANNLTLPGWVDKVYSRMAKTAIIGLTQYSWTPEMQRLSAGRLLYEIIDRFSRSPSQDMEKLVLYSAHDTTLVNVLMAMQVFDGVWPPYASTIIFELRRNVRGKYVNIFYKRNDDVKKITLRGCQNNCQLSDFRDTLEKVILTEEEWEEECRNVTKELYRTLKHRIMDT